MTLEAGVDAKPAVPDYPRAFVRRLPPARAQGRAGRSTVTESIWTTFRLPRSATCGSWVSWAGLGRKGSGFAARASSGAAGPPGRCPAPHGSKPGDARWPGCSGCGCASVRCR
jgi:hypothetical protein